MSKTKGDLFRDPQKGKIAGVCAGIAEYFGWEAWLVRILVVSGVLLGMGWFVLLYIAGWFILDKKPNRFSPKEVAKNVREKLHEEEIFSEPIKVKSKIWQAGEPPKQAVYDINIKFKTLEQELRAMERYVTSPEFTVSREINRL
ncbi:MULTISPECIES: envelope stress response membrane protein PspC [unclassified Thalassotalea]|uniref:envelope stress response membrane protein PspC n=1 Tax=unclassified Thalassotalea TaxID=2614972 RepID=UPI001081B0A4|nr:MULTISPECIES: envelope stress response membrane protein PspC [unclassified Thalassotalea]NMP17552.1 envelope stress response membrane protein PspC [Thalassotalea sp. Y01]QBY05309.1 envelope stress response membrane protein PspC [Thalassotalea sp. HSM 43]